MYSGQELIKFYSKNLRPKRIKSNYRRSSVTKSEKIVQLYQQDYTDDEIAKILYKGEKGQNFRKLKSRMLEQASESILSQIDRVKLRNKYDVSVFTVQKLILVSQLLLLKDSRKVAEPLLKKAFRVSSFIQYTPLIIQSARYLSYSSAYKGDINLVKKYTAVINKQLQIYKNELELESDYFALLTQISNLAEYSDENRRAIKALLTKAKLILEKSKSYALQLLYFRITITYFHSKQDFHSMKIFCRQALSYLDSNPHLFQNSRAGEFSLYEMDSCLRLKQFSLGTKCANQCSQYFIPYSSTWAVFYEYYFLLAMRTLNFDKAFEIYATLNKSQYKMNKMLQRQIEKWKIYEAFLFFVTNEFSDYRQFNLYKYLNDISVFQKDKKGYNFVFLMSKFLLLLNTDHLDELLNLQDSFKLYINRYIKAEVYPRHYIFGKFILKYYKRNFFPAKEEVDYFINELEKHSTLEETEIIPYDVLIKMIYERGK